MKNVVVYSPTRFRDEIWLPALWCQAKTYYEKYGNCRDDWHWVPCLADIHGDDFEAVKLVLEYTEPDVLAVSLYVWNYQMGHRVAQWAKQRWPSCLVVTGGPQQNFLHNNDWFRNRPYIDVSLPGECYGELFFQQLLDNLRDDGSVDFDQLTDACYPRGRSRLPVYSRKRSNIRTKKTFSYDFASFADQAREIQQFIGYCETHLADFNLFAILETTRGCPYGCTYCDWGGGISTAVLQKNVDTVARDLEFLCGLQLKHLYIADANFGIFGERDVAIMTKLIEYRRRNRSKMQLGYGGWAKTENKLPYIKKLVTMDIENGLSNSNEFKISMQSLDEEILKNIDRKNIDIDRQLEIFKPLANHNRLPLYVELIMGLPGMTMEKFYREITVLGQHNLSVMWFEWLLLPETPAYAPEYRRKFGLKTVRKTHGWAWPESESDREIVIACNSYTTEEYLKMLLSAGLYSGIVQGGMYRDSGQWIMHRHGCTMGDLIRSVVESLGIDRDLHLSWEQMLEDPSRAMTVDIATQPVYVMWYWVAQSYFNPTTFQTSMENILIENFDCPQYITAQDSANLITVDNVGQKRRSGIWRYHYGCGKTVQNGWTAVLNDFLSYKHSGRVMLREKKFLL